MICSKCRKREVATGMKRCQMCLEHDKKYYSDNMEARAEYKRKRYADCKRNGICPGCGRKKDCEEEGARCVVCAIKQQEYRMFRER